MLDAAPATQTSKFRSKTYGRVTDACDSVRIGENASVLDAPSDTPDGFVLRSADTCTRAAAKYALYQALVGICRWHSLCIQAHYNHVMHYLMHDADINHRWWTSS